MFVMVEKRDVLTDARTWDDRRTLADVLIRPREFEASNDAGHDTEARTTMTTALAIDDLSPNGGIDCNDTVHANAVIADTDDHRQRRPLETSRREDDDEDDENHDDNSTEDYDDATTTTAQRSSRHRRRRRRRNNNNDKSISSMDAVMHLIKGNLGPGCLNLPHAFVLSGWLLGLVLFLVVVVQGIYSMGLLCVCKWHLRRRHQQQRPQQQQQQHQTHGRAHSVHTFMDVAGAALGPTAGAGVVRILVFVLQTGVCCVFLSLISTNLRASLPRLLPTNTEAVVVTTFGLLGVVLWHDLSQLRWLSTTANVLMLITILTAAIAALLELAGGVSYAIDEDDNNNIDNMNDDALSSTLENRESSNHNMATSDLGHVAAFVASMFFSFEGIGLVLPIEQAFMGENGDDDGDDEVDASDDDDDEWVGENNDGGNTTSENVVQRRQHLFLWRILLGSMTIVASLFLLVGLTCSLAFPDIQSGSITAYLRETFPDQPWYDVVNGLVVVAVFFTFPLQLTPAMEVLEEWFGPGCNPQCWCCGEKNVVGGGMLQLRPELDRQGVQPVQQDDPDRVESGGEEQSHAAIANNKGRDGLMLELSGERNNSNFKGASINNSSTGHDTFDGPYSTLRPTHVDDNTDEADGVFILYETPNPSPTPSQDQAERRMSLPPLPPSPPNNSCFGQREWVFRRWMLVVSCALVVLLVNDLALLMSLFGAVGQTGLALMPCAIHLKLQRQGVVPVSILLSILDCCTIVFSFVVMITGLVFSIQSIVQEKEEDG